MKKLHAVLFAFLMMTMSLAGCLSGDAGVDGEDGAEGVAGPAGEDGSSLHMVVSSADLPDCDSAHLGQIYFVSGEGAFQVCSATGWAVVDLTGPEGPAGSDGLDGTNGTNGANGADGTDGVDGAPGADGTDGLAALAVTTTLSEGNSNCPDGGIQIDVGIDDDDNGSLDAVEIDQTSYICDGADGVNGTDGQDGADGINGTDGADGSQGPPGQDGADGTNGSASPNTMLTSISSPPATMGCDAGGRVMQQGLDNGDGGGTAQNGVLESGEVDYTTTYCSKYSIWQAANIELHNRNYGSGSNPGAYLQYAFGDTLYFSADDGYSGEEIWAYDTSNSSSWMVVDLNNDTNTGSRPGTWVDLLIGNTLYFNADGDVSVNLNGNNNPGGEELWALNLSTSKAWQVTDICSNACSSLPGRYGMEILVGDTIYFGAMTPWIGHELWAHDTSNASTWQVAEINNGSSSSKPGWRMQFLVGDTIYFDANDGNDGTELWAHDTSNHSTWQVADINSGGGHSDPGRWMQILVGDTLYFSANDGSSETELWAHDTSNHSTWQVADINNGNSSSLPGWKTEFLVGDTIYFDANDGNDGRELWAHDTSNHSTWQVADINSGSGDSDPGKAMRDTEILIGYTIYFMADDGNSGHELWAHDTSNHSTWQVADINSGSGHSYPGDYMNILIGDTLFFDADDGNDGRELWAHDTSNHSTWQVADINSGSGSSLPGGAMRTLIGDTFYFSANDGLSGHELWAMTIEHSITYD